MSAHPRLTSEFTVAPDGRGVLFAARDTNALWWLPIGDDGMTAGEPRPTALPVTGPSLASIAVSPDGRRDRVDRGRVEQRHLGHRRRGGAGPRRQPPRRSCRRPRSAGAPRIPRSPPDGRIAFMGNRGNAGNKIFLVEPGRPPRQLTTDARDHFSPFWLRGENALAVLANHGDGMGWWRLDPATGREQLLFPLNDDHEARRRAVAGRRARRRAWRSAATSGVSRSPTCATACRTCGRPRWARTARPGRSSSARSRPISGAFGAWSPDASLAGLPVRRATATRRCAWSTPMARRRRGSSRPTPGTNFIGEWTDDDAILFAAKDRAVWNIRSVARATGKVTAMTAFVEPRFYVRYARWDAANRRVVFER